MSPSSTTTILSTSPAAMDLFSGAHCRRLLKLRHQEMNKMEIKTDILQASLNYEVTRFTVYKLQIASKVRNDKKGEWTLEKRYSEFFIFRRELLKFISEWENQIGGSQKKASTDEFMLVSNALAQPITPNFPRKHMRCDTEQIIKERQDGLQEFVRKLLDAYADISVYLYNTQENDSVSFAKLREVFLQLEKFLDVPDSQKEEERRQTDAILALDDVDIEGVVTPEHTCCICLEDNCPEGAKPHKDHSHRSEKEKMVKLPCNHQFHEDCIIDWFNASTTCPLCRRPAFKECPRVFDVTMRELTEL